MKPIPNDILAQFEVVLNKRAVPAVRHADYRKWLMYYLDFKSRYTLPDSRSEHVRLFIEKLQNKNQSPEQQKQAAHALSLFFESQQWKHHISTVELRENKNGFPPTIRGNDGQKAQYATTSEGLPVRASNTIKVPSNPSVPPFVSPLSGKSRFNDWNCLKNTASTEWDKLINNLAAACVFLSA